MDEGLEKIPLITHGDVLAYLNIDCGWTNERMERHKKDDGYRMFVNQKYIFQELKVTKSEHHTHSDSESYMR